MNRNLSQLIIKGLMNSNSIEDKLIEAIECNENLAPFLAGDVIPPTQEEAIKYVQDYLGEEHALVKIIKIYLSSNFKYVIRFQYSYKRYVVDKDDDEWCCRFQPDKDHTIEKIFENSTEIEYHN